MTMLSVTALDARLAECIRRQCDSCFKLFVYPCADHKGDKVFDGWPAGNRPGQRGYFFVVAQDVAAWTRWRRGEQAEDG